jgi:alpha-N-arabinofuranosidase
MLLTPTYHVFRMFRPFQDATLLPTDLQTPRYTLGDASVPAISVSAARTAAGTIVVALVNLDPGKAMPISLSLPGAAPHGVKGEILTAAALDAHNTFENPDAVHPTAFTSASLKGGKVSLTLPAKSVAVLSLE